MSHFKSYFLSKMNRTMQGCDFSGQFLISGNFAQNFHEIVPCTKILESTLFQSFFFSQSISGNFNHTASHLCSNLEMRLCGFSLIWLEQVSIILPPPHLRKFDCASVNYRLITAYLLLRVSCDKTMHAR